MDNRQDVEEVRFQWIRYAGGIGNLDASIPLALGFIDSDEWELVCSNRDRGAWIEASEFSTMALVRALRMMEEWSESEPGGDYNPHDRGGSLRRKVQRKLERMSEDPSLMIPLSPGHWRVESEEYKNYCRMRFEMSKRMDDSWWSFQKESSTVESGAKPRPTPPTFQMAMNQEGHALTSRLKQRHAAFDKLEGLEKQIWIYQERTQSRSQDLEVEFDQKIRTLKRNKRRDSRNAAHYSWERMLDRRFNRLTVGSEERVWPLKSIPEPDREVGSKKWKMKRGKMSKKKWRIHVNILGIMMERHEPQGTTEAPEKWITRESISNALKEAGEEKTEGRISQVLGDLVGLGAIDKKPDKKDGRIKLYRVKEGFRNRKNRKEDSPEGESPYSLELEQLRAYIYFNRSSNEEQNGMIIKMIDEIKQTLDA